MTDNEKTIIKNEIINLVNRSDGVVINGEVKSWDELFDNSDLNATAQILSLVED